MATTDLSPETMAAMHPDLFCVSRARPPVATFAEQHAAALAVLRQSKPPAVCQLMAELRAVACARRVA